MAGATFGSSFLNSSNIISVGNNTFSGLSSLEVLHLEDNNIGEIRGFEFASLFSLRELYLHNNDLVYINEIAFENLRNLRMLTLDGNLLTVFPVWHLLSNPRLNSLTLSRNTWSCECDFIQPFNFFLEKKSLAIRDYDIIQCMSDNIIDEQAFRSGHLRCGKETSSLSQDPNKTQRLDLVTIIAPVIVAAVILVLGFLAVFVFRKSIKTWLYSKSSEIYESRSGISSVNSSNSTYAQNKLFDIYISYSVKDADFVDQTLAPTLEHGATSYKLCLHQRDFPPSASLFDTVSVATESSSRVILVLSKSYLETEWPHVKIPLRNNANESKLILLFTEDLSEEDVNPHPELIQYFRTCATIRWGSAGFLNKLRFFLPEPAFLTFQRNITLRHHQNRPLPPPGVYRMESLQYQQQYSVYNPAARSEHTYHSIPDNHIYHTLDSQKVTLPQLQQHINAANLNPAAVALNRDLELVLRGADNVSPSPSSYQHSHSHSTSSGTQLLPTISSTKDNRMEEYIV